MLSGSKIVCKLLQCRLSYRSGRSLHVENQLAENLSHQNESAHNFAVDVQGLDDLFQWASEMVSDGTDGRTRRAKDVRMKQQVLKIIHRNAGLAAHAEYQAELAYLHRRTIALQAQLLEKSEELTVTKQIMISQYCELQKVPQLEEKIVQLEAEARKFDQAAMEARKKADDSENEARKKELMTALTKALRERDYLDELLTVNENENVRLVKLLDESRREVDRLKGRKWWQVLFRP